MTIIAMDLQEFWGAIRGVVNEALHVVCMRRAHFMFVRTQETRLPRANQFLNKAKNQEEHGKLFSLLRKTSVRTIW